MSWLWETVPKENLLRLIARLGIENRIVMAGFQKDVSPYYSHGTMLALPSYSEGSPNVVLEAMAAGLPANRRHGTGRCARDPPKPCYRANGAARRSAGHGGGDPGTPPRSRNGGQIGRCSAIARPVGLHARRLQAIADAVLFG